MAQLTWGRPVAVVATAAAAAGAALVWTREVTGLHVSLVLPGGGRPARDRELVAVLRRRSAARRVLVVVAAVLVSRAWAVTGALLALAVSVGFTVRLALDPVIDELSASDLGPGLKLSFLAGVLAMVAAFGVGADD